MTRYGMAVDTKRCFSCNKCAMACKIEHDLPDTMLWNRGLTDGGDFFNVPAGLEPDELEMTFYTMSCQHCDEPACVEACPTGASVKREDGIVTVNYDECIGCKSCIAACPYEGVRTLLEDEERLMDFKMGDQAVPGLVKNTVSKCTFCVERIDRGERPACADVCTMHARYFGDLDDPESEISKVLAERDYDLLLEDQGTAPNLYYLK